MDKGVIITIQPSSLSGCTAARVDQPRRSKLDAGAGDDVVYHTFLFDDSLEVKD
jgi:hypothetical protein